MLSIYDVETAKKTILKRIPPDETKVTPAMLERIAATFEGTNAPPPHHLLIRGSHASEGKEVPPGTPGAEFMLHTTPRHHGVSSTRPGGPPLVPQA